jgi:hypothetical protein
MKTIILSTDVAKELADILGFQGYMITTDGNGSLLRVPISYGTGWNFLNSDIDDYPRFIDIQELIAYITGGVNRWIRAPLHIIPIPSIAMLKQMDASGGAHVSTIDELIPIPAISGETAEDHSGGGLTATPSESIPVPAIAGIAELV